jgi:protein-tyrosine-phosphatase
MKVLFMCTHNSCRSILSEACSTTWRLKEFQKPSVLEAFPVAGVATRAMMTLQSSRYPY